MSDPIGVYWRYKAYDANYQIVDGVIESASFVEMAVRLRQAGWQLIDAITIDRATYLAEQRLQNWHQIIPTSGVPQPQHQTQAICSIRWMMTKLIRLFFGD